MTVDQITPVIQGQLAKIPASVFTNTSIVRVLSHVPFQPYFNAADLAASPNPYTQIAQMQGRRETYWLGSTVTYAESVMVMEHALELINANFPSKI